MLFTGIDIHAQDGEGKTALEIVLKNDQTQPKYAEIAKFIRGINIKHTSNMLKQLSISYIYRKYGSNFIP